MLGAKFMDFEQNIEQIGRFKKNCWKELIIGRKKSKIGASLSVNQTTA